VCGALDANLRTIESALDVRITRRGSTFTIEGDETAPARTASSATVSVAVNDTTRTGCTTSLISVNV